MLKLKFMISYYLESKSFLSFLAIPRPCLLCPAQALVKCVSSFWQTDHSQMEPVRNIIPILNIFAPNNHPTSGISKFSSVPNDTALLMVSFSKNNNFT